MYLILIAWLYVTLMMAIAEATNPIGSVLGGSVTFVLYGLLPMFIVAYLMATPQRKRKLKARREAEQAAWNAANLPKPPVDATAAPETESMAVVPNNPERSQAPNTKT